MQFNAVLPEFLVSDMKASLAFYVETLGFRTEYSREEGRFQFLSFERAQIMLFQEDHIDEDRDRWITGKLESPRGRGVNLQIEVSDLRALLTGLRSKNHPLYADVSERQRNVQGTIIREYEFLVQDPDGYLLRFSSTSAP